MNILNPEIQQPKKLIIDRFDVIFSIEQYFKFYVHNFEEKNQFSYLQIEKIIIYLFIS